MCTGMIYNLVRKLTEDKEDILASREKSLASLAMGGLGESFPDIPSPAKSRASRTTSTGDCNGCYVPPPPGRTYNLWFKDQDFFFELVLGMAAVRDGQ